MKQVIFFTFILSTVFFGCKKDEVSALNVPEKWNGKYNGKFVGIWSEVYWSMGTYTNGPTYSYTVDVTAGSDDNHNHTSITYCSDVQFDETGFCQLYKGQIFERNDSLIYAQQVSGGLGGGTNASFKGKKQ